jgi:hypothetical protein
MIPSTTHRTATFRHRTTLIAISKVSKPLDHRCQSSDPGRIPQLEPKRCTADCTRPDLHALPLTSPTRILSYHILPNHHQPNISVLTRHPRTPLQKHSTSQHRPSSPPDFARFSPRYKHKHILFPLPTDPLRCEVICGCPVLGNNDIQIWRSYADR